MFYKELIMFASCNQYNHILIKIIFAWSWNLGIWTTSLWNEFDQMSNNKI